MKLLRLAAAAGAGVLLALAFPPVGWWPLAIAGVALLTLACLGQRLRWGALFGAVAGLVFFGVLLRWLSIVGTDAWLLLTAFSAAWLGLTGAATSLVTRVPGWLAWVPLVWVGQEFARGRVPLGGWPWGRLGFSQSEAPWLSAAALGGVPLLTAAVAAGGAGLAWAVLHRRSAPLQAVGVTAAVVAAPLLLGLVPRSTDGPARTVAVVQGDVPNTGLGQALSARKAVLDNHVTQTLALAEAVARGGQPQPDAVIWPENSSDLDPYTQPDARAAIDSAARAIDAPILVGAVITNPADPATVLNVGIVWDPVTGPGDRYVKRHPVPFGEYVPFRSLLAGRIQRFSLVPRDYAAGDTAGVLQVGPVVVGDVICFEVAYDEIVRDTVLAGGQTITVQTNNATYTGSGQTEQQLAMARIRSVEHSRSTVVAATNGISAVFQPDGREVARLPESTAGSLVAALPQRTEITLADRLGAWPEALAGLITLIVAIVGWRRRPSVAGVTEPARGVSPAPGQGTPPLPDRMEG